MKVLFDTNVVLDVLLKRHPHADVAAQLLSLVDRGVIEGALCATTITTIHYLAEKAVGRKKACEHITEMMAMFRIAKVDRAVLKQALELSFSDYEDAVLHEAARAFKVDAIVSRNTRDFTKATLPVFDPERLLAAVLAAKA
jgi:predicted nucleic acid-binding protein